MKKIYVVITAVLLMYCSIVFIAPFPKNDVFIVSFVFTIIAILSQSAILTVAFKDADTAKSKFYGITVAKVILIYGVLQIILSFVFMSIAELTQAWIPTIFYILLLGIAFIGTIAADSIREEIIRQDVKIEADISKMRGFQSKVSAIYSVCQNNEIKPQLEKLSEDFKYSDPVSSDALMDVENRIEMLIIQLQNSTHDTVSANGIISQLTATLVERNNLCKLNK